MGPPVLGTLWVALQSRALRTRCDSCTAASAYSIQKQSNKVLRRVRWFKANALPFANTFNEWHRCQLYCHTPSSFAFGCMRSCWNTGNGKLHRYVSIRIRCKYPWTLLCCQLCLLSVPFLHCTGTFISEQGQMSMTMTRKMERTRRHCQRSPPSALLALLADRSSPSWGLALPSKPHPSICASPCYYIH